MRGIFLFVSMLLCSMVSYAQLDCPQSILEESDEGLCSAFVNIPNPTSSTCNIVSIVNDFNNTSDASDDYPVGSTPVTFTATCDDGSTLTCELSVNVVDMTAPELSIGVGGTVCSDSEIQNYSTYAEFIAAGGSASDNCAIDESSFSFLGCVDNGQSCPQVVTCTYRIFDVNGLDVSEDQNWLIDDTVNPVVTCPSDMTLSVDDGTCVADLDLMPTVTDNCSNGNPTISYSYTGDLVGNGTGPVNGSFPAGNYTFTFTATDACDNVSDPCTVNVSIEDEQAPVFTSDPDPIADVTCDNLPDQQDLTATDNCDTDVDVVESQSQPGNPCADYTMTYTWTATDDAGNVANTSVAFTVLADNTPPTVVGTPAAISNIDCTDPLPTQDLSVTASDGCVNATIQFSSTAVSGDICSGIQMEHTYIAIDDCNNESPPTTVTFMINPDIDGPILPAQLPDVTVDNDTGLCTADLSGLVLPTTDVQDCGTIDTPTYTRDDGETDEIFPVGTTVITWTFTDQCGNMSTIDQNVIVTDSEAPQISCNPDLVIGLPSGNPGVATLCATDIVNSSGTSDNCPGPLDYKIQRMTNNCGIASDLSPSDCVTICCEDLGEIMVMTTVTDQAGNPNTCMVSVTVQDKLPPSGSCPTSVTVSCSVEIDVDDLSPFGTIRTNAADVVTNTIDDADAGTTVNVTDGLATDNCNIVSIDVTVVDNRDCGVGTILRTFMVTDESDNSWECTQTITVNNPQPFNEADNITWPATTVEVDACPTPDLSISALGEPTIETKNCSNIFWDYTDTPDTKPVSGCYFFQRQWVVIDWCQYDPNVDPDFGRWEFTQTIEVSDDVPPVIQPLAEPLEVCFSNGLCSVADANITLSVTDECTANADIQVSYQIDIDNDGSFDINGNGVTYSGSLPAGTHSIAWTANDGCGNQAQETYLVNVVDCKPPSPVCINGLSTNLNLMPGMEPMVTIWAKDFNASSTDNCTAEQDLIFSFSTDPLDNQRTFMCSDEGRVTIEMWVTDAAGNQAYCSTYVEVQDNYDLCPEQQPNARLAGNVSTEYDENIPNIEVALESNVNSMTYMTDSLGMYAFEELPMDESYDIAPKKRFDDKAGISTLDIILIQRHILNVETFDSPYKLLAADVNNSSSISASDIVELRKLILEIYDTFPNSDAWKFVANDLTLDYPWDYDASAQMIGLDHSVENLNFVGVKVGDVNQSLTLNNASANTVENRSNADLNLTFATAEANASVACISNEDIYGFEMVLKPTTYVNDVKVLSADLEIEAYNYSWDKATQTLKLSWNANNPVAVKSGGKLFTISSEMTTDWVVNSENSEWYTSDLSTGNINQQTATTVGDVINNDLVRSVPNPFANSTSIQFAMPRAGEATLLVHNEVGELIYGARQVFEAGNQSFVIDGANLDYKTGVYFCTLITEASSHTEKIFYTK